jgi:hypothetical protein
MVSSATATKMSSSAATSALCSLGTLPTAIRYPAPSRISTNSMAPVSLRWSVRARMGEALAATILNDAPCVEEGSRIGEREPKEDGGKAELLEPEYPP